MFLSRRTGKHSVSGKAKLSPELVLCEEELPLLLTDRQINLFHDLKHIFPDGSFRCDGIIMQKVRRVKSDH